MKQLRVENTLYELSDQVWRQVNDLLTKAEGSRQLTHEMLKDVIPPDQPEEAQEDTDLPTEGEDVTHETSENAEGP